MPIRARTSNNGVHVHGNPDSPCATALPYVAGRLAVARRPPERRCRSGACGCGWERPPPSGCLDRHWGRSACARACHPPRRGRSRSIDPMREGRRVARACGNAARHPRSFGILDLKWHRNWHQVGDWRTTCAERLSKGLSTAGRGCSTLYRESTLRSTFHSSIFEPSRRRGFEEDCRILVLEPMHPSNLVPSWRRASAAGHRWLKPRRCKPSDKPCALKHSH